MFTPVFDPGGKRLRVIITDYTTEKVRDTLLRAHLADAGQRADHVKTTQAVFFNYIGPEAREILDDLLEKYAGDGDSQFTLPDVLKVSPISQHGNVSEIIGKFGGAGVLPSLAWQEKTEPSLPGRNYEFLFSP